MYINRAKACEILNIDSSHDLSNDEILRAYRKKALECHPDKTQNATNDEFTKVNLAKEYLLNNTSKTSNSENDTNYMAVLINRMFTSFKTFLVNKMQKDEDIFDFFDAEPTPTTYIIYVELKVSLHELYTESGKKLTVRYKTEYNEYATHIIYVSFLNYHILNVFDGYGDWNPFDNKYGDLHVKLDISIPEHFMINNYIDKLDLIRNVNISIYDYYYGFNKTLMHFNEEICIHHTPAKHGMDISFSNKGLQGTNGHRGELFILFHVDMSQCVDNCFDEHAMKMAFPSLIEQM